ncbi:MAG: hypothetical protein V6Z82_04735 [Flavobacteriales bacterium]
MNQLESSDIMLENDDLKITAGDLCIGYSLTQEVKIILRLNQGELKNDPLLGPNLLQLVKGKPAAQEFKERVKIHLGRDGKDYRSIKSLIHTESKF